MDIPKTGNLIVDLTFSFGVTMLKYCDELSELKKYNIANQLSRSATSIGANVAEAQSSESSADFIHKMKIAQKEAHETQYWLRLCKYADGYKFKDEYNTALNDIIRIIGKIITTTRSRNAVIFPKDT